MCWYLYKCGHVYLQPSAAGRRRLAAALPGRLREDVLVQVLHDLHHQPEAVHEGVDGDAEHAVGRGPVVDVQQHLVLRAGRVSGRP